MTLVDVDLAVELTLSLLVALEHLIESRVQMTNRKHWAWNFARDNFATMSCEIVLKQHAENVDFVKLSQNNASACALEHQNNNFTTHNKNSLVEGVHLCHDRVKNECTRSGNALEGR